MSQDPKQETDDGTLTPEQIQNWRLFLGLRLPDVSDLEIQILKDRFQAQLNAATPTEENA
jgi:hypothetical protein